jgi:hypothetical protein
MMKTNDVEGTVTLELDNQKGTSGAAKAHSKSLRLGQQTLYQISSSSMPGDFVLRAIIHYSRMTKTYHAEPSAKSRLSRLRRGRTDIRLDHCTNGSERDGAVIVNDR